MEISISIEETNKLRQQLGLRPIPVPDESLSAPEQEKAETLASKGSKTGELSLAETNKLRQSLGLKAIELVESAEQREVQNQKRYEQELQKKRKQQEINARVEEAKYSSSRVLLGKTLLDSYEEESTDNWLENLGKTQRTAKKQKQAPQLRTLSGVKLSHGKDLNNLQEDDIFTFEDGDVVGESVDVLSNDRLKSIAKVERDLKEKEKVDEIRSNSYYKPQQDQSSNVQQSEVRDGQIVIRQDDVPEPVEPNKHKVVDGLFDDLDEKQPKPKVTMKKLKKKKEKTKSKRSLDNDYDIELKSVKLAPVDNIENDIDLVLSEQRKKKQQKRANLTPEDIAREVRRVAREREQEELELRGMVGEGITFDATSDFINSLKVDLLDEPKPQTIAKREDQDSATLEGEHSVKHENGDTFTETPSFSTGVGATLKFLRSKEIIKDSKASNESRQAQKQSELLKLRISIEERILKESLENDRQFTSLTKDEQTKILADKLDEVLHQKGILQTGGTRDYRPDVKLVYRDENGRQLNTKQAFKFMSHKFHGTKGKKK